MSDFSTINFARAFANAPVLSANNIRTRQKDVLVVDGVVDINLQEATTFRVNLTEDITGFNIYAESAPGFVTEFTLQLVGDGTARTVTWPEGTDWGGGQALVPPVAEGEIRQVSLKTLDGGLVWVGSAQATPSERKTATVAALAAAYEAEQRVASLYGPRNAPRPEMALAENAITVSDVENPALDADAATLEWHPFGQLYTTDVPRSALDATPIRGINPNLRVFKSGGSNYHIQGKIDRVNTSGNAGTNDLIEPGTTWGMDMSSKYLDFTLYGDVFYLRTSSPGGGATFNITVDGAIAVPTFSGVNVIASSVPWSVQIVTGVQYVKVKFPSWATRRISIAYEKLSVSLSLHFRATSTVVFERSTLRWIALGDSFTDYIVSDESTAVVATQTCQETMHYAFGGGFDFINSGLSSSGFANSSALTPTAVPPYETGKIASIRKVLHTTKGLDADVITVLCGTNDALDTSAPTFIPELRAFIQDVRTFHPNALLVVFGSNARPTQITDGSAVITEEKIAQVCAEMGALHIPMQTRVPAFLRGGGKQGAATGEGNSDLITGPDGIHPTILGHRVLGEFMAWGLYAALPKLGTHP